MSKVFVVYEDWRDRQYPPEITGVYESEFTAMEESIRRRDELEAGGHEDEEDFCMRVEETEFVRKETIEGKMSREEKIQFYELLGKYINEIQPEIDKRQVISAKDKTELLALITMQNHAKVITEFREFLVYDF